MIETKIPKEILQNMAALSQTEIIVKQIKSASNTKSAVNSLADLLLNSEKLRSEDYSRLKDKIVGLRIAISGNGDPSNSMLARLKETEECLDSTNESLTKLNDLIIGNAEDGTGENNLLHMVKNNTRITGNLSRIIWLVIGVLISAATIGVINLI